MSTTVLHTPYYFDENFINKILGEDRFDVRELHDDELADIWGFVKYFYEEDGEKSNLPLRDFKTFCAKVNKDDLRYEVAGIGPSSPNQLARQLSVNRQQTDTEESKIQRINLDRIKQNSTPKIPEYVIRESEDKISITFDREVYLSESDKITGEDYLGNRFYIAIEEIDDRLSEYKKVERDCNNSLTKFQFYI